MAGIIYNEYLAYLLQVSPCGLFAFDRLEKRFKITLTKTLRAFPLDDLEKQRRPVLDGLGEDLEQIPFFVAVDQYAELRELA